MHRRYSIWRIFAVAVTRSYCMCICIWYCSLRWFHSNESFLFPIYKGWPDITMYVYEENKLWKGMCDCFILVASRLNKSQTSKCYFFQNLLSLWFFCWWSVRTMFGYLIHCIAWYNNRSCWILETECCWTGIALSNDRFYLSFENGDNFHDQDALKFWIILVILSHLTA